MDRLSLLVFRALSRDMPTLVAPETSHHAWTVSFTRLTFTRDMSQTTARVTRPSLLPPSIEALVLVVSSPSHHHSRYIWYLAVFP